MLSERSHALHLDGARKQEKDDDDDDERNGITKCHCKRITLLHFVSLVEA